MNTDRQVGTDLGLVKTGSPSTIVLRRKNEVNQTLSKNGT